MLIQKKYKEPDCSFNSPGVITFFVGSGEDIIEWLHRFETTLSIPKIDGADKIDVLKVYVTGFARIVLERYLATREMKELSSAKEHPEIFDKVRDHLQREFQKYDLVRYYMQQLRSLQQGSDESVKEYTRRMQSVVVNLERYGYTVSHMDELTTFEQGLKGDIQRHCSVHPDMPTAHFPSLHPHPMGVPSNVILAMDLVIWLENVRPHA